MTNAFSKEIFPDGTIIDDWFHGDTLPTLDSLGKQYLITDYGIFSDGKIYTEQFQALIDLIHANGGGVIVIPSGTFYSGSLFFKQGVNLYVQENGTLKGSDDVSDYKLLTTRIEGETCLYFSALINADFVDGIKICGKGVIDGNGEKSWKAFWLRRKWNPNCTNKDEQRPRLIYLSNCNNALIGGLTLQNSHFWTNHIYKCNHVKFLNLKILSPTKPVLAPSTDAIDIDVCSDVLVKNCYMAVNDDSVVLKGGKGPWADQDENNGPNERILVEDCVYGFCHSGITCGSESVHNKNVLVRRLKVDNIMQLIHFKLRPDTPQLYEYIQIEEVTGSILGNFLNINPWTQFFDLKGRTDKPISKAQYVTVKNCDCSCDVFFNVNKSKDYLLTDFTLQNLKIKTNNKGSDYSVIDNVTVDGIHIEEVKNEND